MATLGFLRRDFEVFGFCCNRGQRLIDRVDILPVPAALAYTRDNGSNNAHLAAVRAGNGRERFFG